MPRQQLSSINTLDTKRRLRKKTWLKVGTYAIMLVVTLVMITPFLWMISSSFKTLAEIFRYPPTIVPAQPTLEGYMKLFRQFPFARNMLNSAYIAAAYTLLAVFFCTLGGFGFGKYSFKGDKILFAVLIGSMFIPFEVTMIPLYVVFRKIGWIDSHWGLIIPGVANAFGIFFMRQNIGSIPDELMDAARVDGCSEFRIFFNIIMPIAKPAMASLGIIFFMNSWNSFLWPLVLLQRPELMTVTVALRSLQDPIRTPFDQIMAGSTLSTLPLIIAFLLLQRYFMAGITAGAIKG
jgi:ABC-type glycerol-3-phosphate transport system permease component